MNCYCIIVYFKINNKKAPNIGAFYYLFISWTGGASFFVLSNSHKQLLMR